MNPQYGFLIDLDGTMYAGRQRIPYANEFIVLLKGLGLPYLFVTNNSSRTPEAVAEHLRHIHIPAEAEEVVTSSQAAAEYIAETYGRGTGVFVVGEEGLRLALEEAGLRLVDNAPDVVVQGIDRAFNYDTLSRAAGFIRDGAKYVLTNPDRMLPADGKLHPGAGSLSAAIQSASGIHPTVIGKPHEPIMRYALRQLPNTDQVWVVGDNLWTDIAAGAGAGLRTALVLTGLATKDNVKSQIELSGVTPDRIADHLMQLAEQLMLLPQG